MHRRIDIACQYPRNIIGNAPHFHGGIIRGCKYMEFSLIRFTYIFYNGIKPVTQDRTAGFFGPFFIYLFQHVITFIIIVIIIQDFLRGAGVHIKGIAFQASCHAVSVLKRLCLRILPVPAERARPLFKLPEMHNYRRVLWRL